MKIRAAAFTEAGEAWAEILGLEIDRPTQVYRWAETHFYDHDALLFIGATGIAVRAIAPLLRDKTRDPAVLVMDEKGRYLIPILSGHIGGANALATEIAARIGAQAVVTTATDLNGITAIDSWATRHDCAIENPARIKNVSAAALKGQEVGVAISERLMEPPFPVTLWLRPRSLVLGVGCRRGVPWQRFEEAVRDFWRRCEVSPLSIRALASIDLKKDEEALLRFAEKYQLPFYLYQASELAALAGVFSHSDYVQSVAGVGNVCERAAVKASEGGRLLVGKTLYEGISLSLAGEKP